VAVEQIGDEFTHARNYSISLEIHAKGSLHRHLEVFILFLFFVCLFFVCFWIVSTWFIFGSFLIPF